MATKNNNYDFHYSGETNMIVFAAENDDYYSLMLQADAARTIDLSGGTRCIETIKFQKCHKMSRIIWPHDTSTIRSLSIYAAESLTKLDLTPLTNLESLSILDCPALSMLIGLPKELKTINLHHTQLKQLDLQQTSEIVTVNIHTTLDHFKLIGEQRNYLQHVMIKVEGSTKNHLQCKLTNCAILNDIYIDAEKCAVKLNIKNSTSLKELTIIAGDDSSIYGLAACKQMKYMHTSSHVILKDIEAALLEQRTKQNSREMDYSLGKKAQQFNDTQLQFQIDAAAHNPHFDDKETVIQHINSRREFEQGIGATLSLLSHPMEHVIEISQHDLRKMKKISNDATPKFLVESTLTPFYIMGSDLCPHPARLIKNAKTTLNSKDPIEDCIHNHHILLLTDRDLTNKSLLNRFLQLLRHPQYKNRVVFIAGKLKIMNKLIPGFSRKVIPITLPTKKQKETYHYQYVMDDMTDILAAINIAEDSAEALTAATAFSTAMNAYNLNIELPSSNNRKHRPELDTQDPIDSKAAHTEIEPDMQVPLEAIAAHRERSPPDEQELIDGTAENKERPLPDDQTEINAAKAHTDPTPLDQSSIAGDASHRELPLVDEQIAINAASESPIQMTWPYEQSTIEANAEHSPSLKPVAPLVPTHTNDQLFFAANMKAREPLQDAPKLVIDDTNKQVLLEINKKLLQPQETKKLIPDEPNKQLLLEAEKSIKAPLAEATKLIVDETPDQFLLQATQSKSEDRLLKVARDLAIATQRLIDAAIEKHDKSESLQRAEVLIKTVARELNHVQHITIKQPSAATHMHKEDLLAAAKNLTDGIKELADVCRADLNLKPSPTPEPNDMLKKNIKKNE